MPGHGELNTCSMCDCRFQHNTHHMPWLTPPMPPPGYMEYYQESYAASSSRQSRNQAEKQRRDKLNQFINELAGLVPMVASSAKRLDKTSILRLSATFLRMHHILLNGKETKSKELAIPMNWCQYILEGMDGILIVVTASGKIVFITHNVENILGHPQTDLLGQSLFTITSLEDHDELKRNLKSNNELDMPSTSTDVVSSSVSQEREPERRSFYLRLRQKSLSKSDQPQFELVHVMGHLRIPPPSPPNKKNRGAEQQHISNEVVLVALMKPFKETRVTENSLIEATREEWITRHLIDGTIVFSDHRISVVSGYMSEEVTGLPAFRYMHPDDVRWVMIALRQMYYRGESYGSSCYRLLSKNNEFIYIRTHGYLELNEDTNSVLSFICINSLVSPEEGEAQIAQMKALYTPLVAQGDNLVSGIADHKYLQEKGNGSALLEPLEVNDPQELKCAIDQLLSNLPADQIHPHHTGQAPDDQFAKITMFSKSMPPVTVQSNKVGVKMPSIKKGPSYTRPSVITRAKDKRVKADEIHTTVVKRLRSETSVITIAETSRSVIRSREEYNAIPTDECLEPSLGGPSGYLPPQQPPSSPLGAYLASPQDSRPPQGATYIQLEQRTAAPSVDFLFANELSSSLLSGMDTGDERAQFGNLTIPLDDALQDPVNTLALWDSNINNLEEDVGRGHNHLQERINYQDSQMSAIEEDLTSVPMTSAGTHIYRSTFSHLKAEHRKQQQLLKTLQQDHQNIQHCKDQLPVLGAQDIGA